MKNLTLNSTGNLTRMDYYQIITSVMMTIIGGIILLRTFLSGIFVASFLVGGGLLGLGIYRLSFVYRYFRNSKK
jgi:hypothetical protein